MLVLGGAGDMGSGIVEELCKLGVDVCIGDIRIQEAERIAGSIKEVGKVSAVKVDVNSREELITIAKQYELVINAVGPFYKYGYRVASTLVEAGVDFIDICDDYDATQNILALSEKAEENCVVGITGLGWTPGISNLLAKKGYEELGGEVDAIDIWWFGSASDSKGLAVVMHLFYALTGEVPMYLEGRQTFVKVGSSPSFTDFPQVGVLKLYYTGHPEPITIPRSIKVTNRVMIRGGLIPQWQNNLAKIFVKLGLTSTKRRLETLSRFLYQIEDIFRSGGKPISGVRVDIEKRDKSVSYSIIDRMRRLTSIPASIGADLILRKKVKSLGVHPPEEIIDTAYFFQELSKKGLEVVKL